MAKINVAYIIERENNVFFACSLESSLTFADKVIIIYSESDDGTLDLIKRVGDYTHQSHKIEVVNVPYRHKDKGANGMQRNEYLKRIPDGEWCVVLDGDEVLSDNAFILREYADLDVYPCYDVLMIHFIYNLGWVDATVKEHFCPHRFFKKRKGLWYPETEHPVLQGFDSDEVHTLREVGIFHFGGVKGVESVIKKYHNHVLKSEMHTKDFLNWWKNSQLFGTYPIVKFNEIDLYPFTIKREFGDV